MTSSLASRFFGSVRARRAVASFGFAATATTFVAAGAGATTGCVLNCTLVGCFSAIRVTIDGASADAKLSVAVEGAGRTLNVDADVGAGTCVVDDPPVGTCTVVDGAVEIDLLLPDAFEDESTSLTVTATDAVGATVIDVTHAVTMRVSEPNGSSCGPTCYNAEEHFDL